MKIVEQTSKKIQFRHLPIGKWTNSLLLSFGGTLLSCLCLYIIFQPAKSQLNCTRTQPSIGICELEERALGVPQKRDITIDTLQEAKIYDSNVTNYSSYKIILVTRTEEIYLEASASREETAQQLANRINNFIANQEEKSLSVEIEEGSSDFFMKFILGLGGIFFAFSPFIALQALNFPRETWIFDKNSGKFTVIKQWLSRKQSTEYSLSQIVNIELIEPSSLIEVSVQSGDKITLEWENMFFADKVEHEIKIARVVETIREFINFRT
jgi:hypothetical protein